MNFFNRNPWLLPLIGGLIAFISLFTPVTTWNPPGNYAIQWMVQLGLRLEPFVVFELWRTDPGLLSLSITLAVLICASSLIIIVLTTIFKINSKNFHKVKWLWLIGAILIILSTLAWIIMMELVYMADGSSHWQSYDPNFGVIGPFVGASLIILGVYFAGIPRESK